MLEARRCIQCKKPGCIAGCPVDVDIPGFIKLIAEGEFIEAALQAQGDERPARRLRPGLSAGGPVREGLHPREEGRARGHRPPGAVRRRLRAAGGQDRHPRAGEAQREKGRRRRRRSRGAHDRRRSGQAGLRRDDLRGPAQGGRRAGLRDPRVPTAQGDRGGGGGVSAETGREDRDERRHRPAQDGGRALRGGVRRGLPRGRRRRPGLHEHPRREPERHLFGQRVPHPLQPHEGLPLSRVRHAHRPGEERRRDRRRERGHGLGPDRPAPGGG